MKTDKTTYSNELLAAATILRETAAKAAPGPWTSGLPSWAGGAVGVEKHEPYAEEIAKRLSMNDLFSETAP